MRYDRSRSLVGVRVSASVEESSSSIVEKKRKVVEHVCLLKAKEDLSQEKENNMLDYLYTTQYQMGGILSISLGRVSNQNDDNYTHAVYMRFQRKEDLVKFYEKPFYLGVLKEHVLPYCHGLLNLDYESEVEDDILPIFRKGEEFNYGVEFVLLISFMDNIIGRVEDALACLQSLIMGFPSLVVQSTHGQNFNLRNKEYTHAAVIRFRSLEAFQIFESSSEYKKIWKTKFEPITRKTLSVYYLVDPVGTEIM
ncbi:Transcription regulator AsnC-type [Trema orientale]|uniref:Transcription regulator AsnC-type n=1 Tax=Trema orientale TaxID=63057 RepID=A0A2P5ELR5_TREOI|nr:Transcription regulator AsnC-type [Trema orientale]